MIQIQGRTTWQITHKLKRIYLYLKSFKFGEYQMYLTAKEIKNLAEYALGIEIKENV